MHKDKEKNDEKNLPTVTTGHVVPTGNLLQSDHKPDKSMSMEVMSASTWGAPSAVQNNENVWLDNRSSHTIYYKPESGDRNSQAIALRPGQKGMEPFDGVAAPHMKKGEVYKVVTGVRGWISDDDFGALSSLGPKQGVGQLLTGGYKDSAWLYDMTATSRKDVVSGRLDVKTSTSQLTPDYSWVELFRSSGLSNMSRYTDPHTITKYSNNLNGPK